MRSSRSLVRRLKATRIPLSLKMRRRWPRRKVHVFGGLPGNAERRVTGGKAALLGHAAPTPWARGWPAQPGADRRGRLGHPWLAPWHGLGCPSHISPRPVIRGSGQREGTWATRDRGHHGLSDGNGAQEQRPRVRILPPPHNARHPLSECFPQATGACTCKGLEKRRTVSPVTDG